MEIYQICLILFIIVFEKGNAIRCYDCTITRSSVLGVTNGCTGLSPTTCPSGQNYCSTRTSSNTFSGIDSRIEIRGCSFSSQAEPCRIVTVANIDNTVCSTICSTDGCNRDSSAGNPLTPQVNAASSGLKCYQCTHSSEASIDNCASASPKPCSSGQNFCSSISTTINGISATQRICSPQSFSGCSTVNGLRVCTTSCSTDGCNNGSGKIRLSLIGFLLTTIISYVILNN